MNEHQWSGSIEVGTRSRHPLLTFLAFDYVAGLFDLNVQSLFNQGANSHYFLKITHLSSKKYWVINIHFEMNHRWLPCIALPLYNKL